jgi:hypothetical protein
VGLRELVEVYLGWGFVVKVSVGFVVVVFSESFHVIESWIVELEGLEEAFDLVLRCGFSNGTPHVLYAMCF